MVRAFSSDAIIVVDGFLTEAEQSNILACCSESIWRYGWPINSAPFARQCWHSFISGSRRKGQVCCEDELRSDSRWGFLIFIWDRIKKEYLDSVKLLGVYANGQTTGQDAPIHRDNRSDEAGYTVIFFCNGHWATSWGGELVFYDDAKKNIVRAVLPKPGRIVIFDGHIPHAARSPTISCDQLRMTIAFKTIKKE